MPARAGARQAKSRIRALMLSAATAPIACFVSASGVHAQVPTTLKDCEQTDSAPLVVRACTAVLNGSELEPAERKRLLILRGIGWSKEEEYHAADEDFTSALAIEPDNVAAREGRANARTKNKAFLELAEDWTELIALQPKNDLYYRSRGLARIGAAQYQEALADFDVSLGMNPKEVEAYMGRAQVFDAMKDIERAKAEFNKAIAVNDRYLPLFWMRGEMARAWGDKELALASYTQVLAINSLHEDARRRMFYLGVLHPP